MEQRWIDESAGLGPFDPADTRSRVPKEIGEVGESVALLLLVELGHDVFWDPGKTGVHGVDLLVLTPGGDVLALEVKATLRAGSIPRLTPSRLRQMSREWLNKPGNRGMVDWEFTADDLYAGVMVVDFATLDFRVAVSGDFETYSPVARLEQLESLRWLDEAGV